MKHYRVTFDLVLNDEAGHPRKWVPDAVYQGLEAGEDISNWEFTEQPASEPIDVEATWVNQ